ncbi:MAG: ECF transporter S component [Armatimonadota bacterium]|nr:ECF transporter S component [Armatimonadota bacterium]MDW8155040.1 ECF transporter S component [Armatimonadota bacterium]
MRARRLASLAMLSALSALLMRLIQFPILPGAPYLKFDPSEVPTLLAGILFGPSAGVAVAFLKNVLYVVLFGSPTGWVGPFANFAAVSFFAATAAWAYRREPNLVGLTKGVAAGAVARAVFMVPVLAFVVLPAFLHYSPLDWAILQRRVAPLLLSVFVPFNLITSVLNGAITLWLVAAVRTRVPALAGYPARRGA